MSVTPSLPRPSDRWIPWYFVMFFAVVFSVLGGMVYMALHTYTGVTTKNSYEKGLAYNKAIEAEAQQEALGWRGELRLTPDAAGEARVDFSLRDADGKPIEKADVKLMMVRPTRDGMDQSTVMQMAADGHYTVAIHLPAQGLWEARLAVMAQGKNYQMTKRVVVP